jgi:hypothetical protein
MAFFGGLAVFILPIMIPVVLDIRDDFAADFNSTDEQRLWFFVAGILLAQVGVGIYWAIMGIAGAIRFLKGLGDLGRVVVVEGEVVKVHNNRVAVDDGKSDETTAWFRPPDCPSLSRGDRVRVTRTPYLHYVRRVELLPGLST